MLKKNKWKLLISSLLVLLPILIGLLFWNQLPEMMTMHWGADGVADGSVGKGFVVFVLPLILLAVHWLGVIATAKDPGNKEQSPKVFGMLLWIMPFISLLTNGMIYFAAMGKTLNVICLVLLLMGLLFIVMGNYMPKCKQNYTIGIKIKWTLESEENWNATHRLTGKVYVIGGILLMLSMLLPENIIPWIIVPVFIAMIGVPIVYSYLFYKKQLKAGIQPEKTMQPVSKKMKVFSTIMLVAIAALVIVICFTGSISVQFGDTELQVKASFYQDLTIAYKRIDEMEYREDFRTGFRAYGFGTPKLSIGSFQNDEFGAYTLYAYTGSKAHIVLDQDGYKVVISGENQAETQKIYEELRQKIDQ